MAKLYANENFPRLTVGRLRELGHDVLTIQESGHANQRFTDPQVLEFAVHQQRAVLTYNRQDFIRLHSEQPQHEGIIVCTVDRDVLALAERIHQMIIALPSLQNELIRVNRPANEAT